MIAENFSKPTIWSDKYADDIFSKKIRARDPICKRCKMRASTDCSHYFERHHSALRFHEDNADGVCRPCHALWEGRKNGYKEYKIMQIGKKRFRWLEVQAYQNTMQRSDAIIQFMQSQKDAAAIS